jgi:hypothetical protein
VKTILWKELREGLKWGAAGLLGLGAALALMLSTMLRHGSLGFRDHDVLVRNEVLVVLGLGTAIVGLALGILQVVFESRGDRWALLVHRPISRSRIFLAKALVGSCLYLAAAGIPFGIACGTMAVLDGVPGRLPGPFTWRMLLPGTALIVSGLAYYFAGMLVGIRQARWYLSRALPVGAAVFATVAVLATLTFPWAVVLALAVAAVLATAAWGSFCSGGQPCVRPWPAKAALAVTLLAGVTVAASVIVGPIAALIDDTSQERTRTMLDMDREGKLLLLTQRDSRLVSITETDGTPPEEYRGVELRWESIGERLARLTWITLVADEVWSRGWRHYLIDVGADLLDNSPGGSWFYLRDQGVIAVYDGPDGSLSKYVGPESTSGPPALPAVRFPAGGWALPLALMLPRVLVFPDAMYRVAGDGKSLELVFTAAVGDPVEGAGQLMLRQEAGIDKTPMTVVVTRGAVHGVGRDGTRLFTVPRKSEWVTAHGWGSSWGLGVGRLEGGRTALWHGPMALASEDAGAPASHVQIVDASGKLESETDVPRGKHPADRRPATEWAVVTVVPLAFHGLALFVGLEPPLEMTEELGQGALRLLVWMILVALLSAALGWALARQRGLTPGWTRAWAVAGFLFGLLGILTLLALEEQPARERCVGCGKRRVVSRASCEHCRARWPAPALEGTEIFA